ncbi:Protein ZDS1 [Gossypium arboreum]|uniref:Protein ZDS1 n=1 Tax=Gossypium arboreum TaxID=29729 RepID=A0A0B0NAZ1_GOSAR|nr:Protein ZDS1 [Gossypium arboreum]
MPSRARTSLCNKRLSESSFTLISSRSNGRNQDDSLIKHGEYWPQHDELHGACFNASEVTTGKTNDNTNGGMVEISDDDRLDKMLEFSSKNIWEHVESDEFMEHMRQPGRVGDHVDNDHHGV